MKSITYLLLLIFGLTSISLMAQKADSVVVIYDTQKTIIPVPAFGSQTTIKMADSIEIIEIGVSRRKPNDNFVQPKNSTNSSEGNMLSSKTKWFSQIEVGYISEFVSDTWLKEYNSIPHYLEYSLNTQNLSGFRIALSINEKEKRINNAYSYVSGFKFGFVQSFRKATPKPIFEDTLNHQFIGYDAFNNSSIQFSIPVGFRYHFRAGKLPAQINFGANIGASLEFLRGNSPYLPRQKYRGIAILTQPYVGMEIGKIGLLATTDLSFLSTQNFYSSKNTFWENNFDSNFRIGISLTYRFF